MKNLFRLDALLLLTATLFISNPATAQCPTYQSLYQAMKNLPSGLFSLGQVLPPKEISKTPCHVALGFNRENFQIVFVIPRTGKTTAFKSINLTSDCKLETCGIQSKVAEKIFAWTKEQLQAINTPTTPGSLVWIKNFPYPSSLKEVQDLNTNEPGNDAILWSYSLGLQEKYPVKIRFFSPDTSIVGLLADWTGDSTLHLETSSGVFKVHRSYFKGDVWDDEITYPFFVNPRGDTIREEVKLHPLYATILEDPRPEANEDYYDELQRNFYVFKASTSETWIIHRDIHRVRGQAPDYMAGYIVQNGERVRFLNGLELSQAIAAAIAADKEK